MALTLGFLAADHPSHSAWTNLICCNVTYSQTKIQVSITTVTVGRRQINCMACRYPTIDHITAITIMKANPCLTVKVEPNGGITFPQRVFGRDLVVAGILRCDVIDLQHQEVGLVVTWLRTDLDAACKQITRTDSDRLTLLNELHINYYHL